MRVLAATLLAALASGSLALLYINMNHAAPVETAADSSPAENTRPAPRASDDAPLSLPLINPKIVVMKSRRLMELYSGGQVVRTYPIGLGFTPIGDKQRQGDGRTPEGEFYVCVKNPRSKFYLSLGLSYPGIDDARRGLREGLISRAQHDQIVRAIQAKRLPPQGTRLGGEIYIHGNGSQSDWTWGCVALDDQNMKELYEAVPKGTVVVIEP